MPMPHKEAPFWAALEQRIVKHERLICFIISALLCIYIPLKITSMGFSPADDALRHAAFVLTEKNWSDIVLIQPGLEADHNPGWHSILRLLHRKFGLNQDDLLLFSVVSLFFLFNLIGLCTAKHPASWLAAMFMLGTSHRFLLGRPFILSCAALALLLFLWHEKESLSTAKKYAASIFVIAIITWVHGSWYLFLLLSAAFCLAGYYKESLHITICILIGTVLGAFLTPEPLEFLRFHFVVPIDIFFKEKLVTRQYVTEFVPSFFQYQLWVIAAALFIAVYIKKCVSVSYLICSPYLMLAMLCSVLGIFVVRFWLDWGLVGMLMFVSCLVSKLIDSSAVLKKPRVRYSLFIFIAVAFAGSYTADINSRYSERLFIEAIDFSKPELKGWAPGDDGIIYSSSMSTFYQHFFKYPNAPWRYSTGFEVSIMPDEDRKILRDIQYSGIKAAYDPWLNKLRPQDRMIEPAGTQTLPHDDIEWKRGSLYFIIGRKKPNTPTGLNENGQNTGVKPDTPTDLNENGQNTGVKPDTQHDN